MAQIINFTYLIVLVICLGCGDEVDYSSKLTEADKNDIINEGYGAYLDSIGRDRAFFNIYAILEDTCDMTQILYGIEVKKTKDCSHGNKDVMFPAHFENQLINASPFPNFHLVNVAYVDSLFKATSQHELFGQQSYAITRPFQPDSCDLAIIQEYPLPNPVGCIPQRERYLVFKKIDGRWKCTHSF